MKSVHEWSKAFNLLWNNIASGKAPGLEEYEKSVILTEAQNALVKDYFSSNSNVWKEGIDDSARRQADFATLISSKKLEQVTNLDSTENFRERPFTKYFISPSDAMYVLNEEVSAMGLSTSAVYYTVVPISAAEYSRLMTAPYKLPPKDMVWKIVSHTGTDGEVSYPTIELIGKFPQGYSIDYRMRYVRRPRPIILENLLGGLSIDGQTEESECELPEHLHDEILQRAVQIAKIAWIDKKSNVNTQQ